MRGGPGWRAGSPRLAAGRPGPGHLSPRRRSETGRSRQTCCEEGVCWRPCVGGYIYDVMAARAIGSGTISFGLVNIPVKVYAATESAARISFNQLHDKCKGRLRQQMYCPTDDEVVSREHIVKGYEFAKDQYVLFSPEELKALEEESTKQMEITEFVPLAAVDPLYFESGYFLGPDKGAE